MKLRWLSNIYDPKRSDTKYFFVSISRHETPQQVLNSHLEWLEGKFIADPQATERYTVEELKEQNMVGVYILEEE